MASECSHLLNTLEYLVRISESTLLRVLLQGPALKDFHGDFNAIFACVIDPLRSVNHAPELSMLAILNLAKSNGLILQSPHRVKEEWKWGENSRTSGGGAAR